MKVILSIVYLIISIHCVAGMKAELPEPEKFGIKIGISKISDLANFEHFYSDSDNKKHYRVTKASSYTTSLGYPSEVTVVVNESDVVVTFLCAYDASIIQTTRGILSESKKYKRNEEVFDAWKDIDNPTNRHPTIIYNYHDSINFGLQVNKDENVCALFWGLLY